MKSSKISSEKYKSFKTNAVNQNGKTKKSQSSEGLNTKNSIKSSVKVTKFKHSVSNPNELETNKMLNDHEIAELAFNQEYESAFEKFWKSVTDGIDRQPHDSIPRSTPIDAKIFEIQKRIKLNQAILQNANEKMKGITFAAERENLSQWKEGLAFRNPSRDDLNRFKDVKALDLEIQKLRESKPDRNVFLKSSPGIVNFHETMESTLSMLDKIQKTDELDDYDVTYRDIKNEFHLDFIKAPNLVAVSDEE